ncbi:MAG: hypothetical protein CL678_09165 [Bdellovibrionaceae bacterium]|nr:hypothetical protein [Pseudobdellovibrionaceae bacterium]|tara:strand:- start:1085 stop:1576 length:492 start_codon:yes stop_codon:yes gene_type:complete
MEEDFNLVEFWVQKKPKRWMAGVFAGLFAGLFSMTFASILAVMAGHEFWYAVKVPALPILGASATEVGMNMTSILVGFIAYEFLCVFWAVVFSHFVFSNAIKVLVPMGMVWACFSWIFLHNLFSKSWHDVKVADTSAGAAFFICVAYGLGLVSLRFFDKILNR